MMKEYRHDIDLVKGIAIIAVVLFHLGLVKTGYLGVDAFFVINGFFLVPSLCRNIEEKKFSFFIFLEKRILRLLPMIVLASLVCLVVGYIGMLPDDYENLAQTVVASNLFSQNILAEMTVSNYWNAVNDFKPLMHLWYVGILAEFYIVTPLILLLVTKICNRLHYDRMIACKSILALLTILSFVLYLSPFMSDSEKFYHLPCRFYELSIGGVIALMLPQNCALFGTGKRCLKSFIILSLLTLVIFSSLFKFDINAIGNPPVIVGSDRVIDEGLVMPRTWLLLLTVTFTTMFVNIRECKVKGKFFEWFGRRSYSIYIWHQVILGFTRYYYTTEITVTMLLVFLFITLLLSETTYCLLEQRVRVNHHTLYMVLLGALVCVLLGAGVYMRAGVIRDVPELGIKNGEGIRGMFAEYCDRNYAYNKDFPNENGKINVIVEGISYGRDFCNVILESDVKDSVNLSYIEKWEDADYTDRLMKADVIFTFRAKHKVPQYVWKVVNDKQVIGLGPKAFGICNGQVYSHRNEPNYLRLTVKAFTECIQLNDSWKKEWGGNYVDFMTPVVEKDRVKVFTPEGKFISQDCRHLTPAGAQWYGKILHLNRLVKRY